MLEGYLYLFIPRNFHSMLGIIKPGEIDEANEIYFLAFDDTRL